MTEEQVLTVRQVADLLQIGEKKAYTMAQRGELPAFKVGSQWRFQLTDIQTWMKAQVQAHQQVTVKR